MTLERLRDVMTGHEDNAIMPLFWLKGGPVEIVRDEMERIADAGIGAVIVEARPHPEFLSGGWWRDVDAIIEIARRRGMKVWFFDDDSFPTGHAAGAVVDAPESLRRRFVSERHTDAVGPMVGSSFLVDRTPPFGSAASRDGGDLLRVVAYRRAADSDELSGAPLDLTDRIVDGVLYWDVPEGWWRLFFLTVGAGGSVRHGHHIDYLQPDSTRLLLDSVHERIHARYADEFGGVIAGFFSDEPGVYNDPDSFDYHSTLGKPVPLPWNDALYARLSDTVGADATTLLPLLWHRAAGAERRMRYAFMDAVSRQYSDSFSRLVGEWCRSHGVEYIGHVIEDNGSHTRLGPGAGHYFRAMAGQDMSGIDIIGTQVAPGHSVGPVATVPGDANGEFYHFGLAKLASSAAHIDPLKRGRSVSETMGAYGWYAGLRLFAWLTNHLLVRGITHIVPHAFSPAPFPDPDCPPHFYARGSNPQYRHHHMLSDYTNRVSHLLQGGTHVAPFAVLYHADAEWLGDAMPSERPVRLLACAQLDADIVPADALGGADATGARLRLADETYDALIVPGSDFLPAHVAGEILRLDDAGVPVVFVDRVPLVLGPREHVLRDRFIAIRQSTLADVVAPMTTRAVRVAATAPSLRAYRVDHGDADVVLLFNESVSETVRTSLIIPRSGEAVAVDAYTARLVALPTSGHDVVTVDVELAPGEALLMVCGSPDAWAGLEVAPHIERATPTPLELRWQVATATADAYPRFTLWREIDSLGPIDGPGMLPTFSGTLRYTAQFESTDRGAGRLDLGHVHEIAEVRLNGVGLGTRIAPPYVFDVPAGVLASHNTLEVEVVNTLVKAHPDFFSAFAQLAPSGLIGPVTLAGVVTPSAAHTP